MKVILGSASPRRKDLLKEIFDEFEIMPSNFDEDSIKQDETRPGELVETLSKCKGEEVFSRIKSKDDFVIISSDTMVFCKDKLLGKPKDKEEAFEMLKMLENNMHTVYTGLFILIKQGEKIERVLTHSKTDVYFKKLSDEQILEYIEKENPLDQAGSYAIQKGAKEFVDRIEGNYNTVVGLDIEKLKEILEKYV